MRSRSDRQWQRAEIPFRMPASPLTTVAVDNVVKLHSHRL
jgi:hypothetical protein